MLAVTKLQSYEHEGRQFLAVQFASGEGERISIALEGNGTIRADALRHGLTMLGDAIDRRMAESKDAASG